MLSGPIDSSCHACQAAAEENVNRGRWQCCTGAPQCHRRQQGEPPPPGPHGAQVRPHWCCVQYQEQRARRVARSEAPTLQVDESAAKAEGGRYRMMRRACVARGDRHGALETTARPRWGVSSVHNSAHTTRLDRKWQRRQEVRPRVRLGLVVVLDIVLIL